MVRPDADLMFEEIVRALDEPFADPSALPTFLVSHLARRDVTVALSGDGGDELFGGYTRYIELNGVAELPPVARSVLRVVCAHACRTWRSAGIACWRWVARCAGATRARWRFPCASRRAAAASSDVAERARPFDQVLDRVVRRAAERDFMTQLMIVDMQSYLPGDILTKVDRMSMAHSLEARVPLLDHVLAEFALSLPARLKLRDGVGKWVLRRAIRRSVPPRC